MECRDQRREPVKHGIAISDLSGETRVGGKKPHRFQEIATRAHWCRDATIRVREAILAGQPAMDRGWAIADGISHGLQRLDNATLDT